MNEHMSFARGFIELLKCAHTSLKNIARRKKDGQQMFDGWRIHEVFPSNSRKLSKQATLHSSH